MAEQLPQVSKLAGALTEHQRWFEVLSSEDRQWVISNTKDAIALFVNAVRNRETSEVSNLFNPHAYFKTREGLWVADSFTNRVLPEVSSMSPRGLEGVTSHTLARNIHDKEIIDELLGGMEEAHKHAFTLDQVAAKIDLQPNGEDGELLNNGYANIFYVLVDEVLFAVSVSWHSDDREWDVLDWHLGESGRWSAGGRVFRNTTLAV